MVPTDPTLFENFQLRGDWWLPGKEADKVPGTLKYDGKEMILELNGTFRKISPTVLSRILSSHAALEQYPIVLGLLDDHSSCTLHRTFEKSVNSSGVSLFVHFCFVGGHFSTPSDLVFDSVSINVTNLEEWLSYAPFDTDCQNFTVKFTPPEPFEAEIPSLSAAFCTDFKVSMTGGGFPSVSLNYVAYLHLKPNSPRNLNCHLEAIGQLRNLLTLLCGESVHMQRVRFTYRDPGSESHQRKADWVSLCYLQVGDKDPRKLLPVQMLFAFPAVKSILPGILERWFSSNLTIQTARNIFFSTLYRQSGFIEARFLTLVHALEAYSRANEGGKYLADEDYEKLRQSLVAAIPHDTQKDLCQSLERRLRYGNEHSLRKRIDSVIGSLDEETRKLVCLSPTAFQNGIVNTRNYFTHYADELREKALRGSDLHHACERLRVLLTILFLRELGIGEPRVRNAISNNWYLKQVIHAYLNAREAC